MRRGEPGQPLGRALSGWVPPPAPNSVRLAGRHCAVEPLDPARHAARLYDAIAADERDWIYVTTDRPPDRAAHDRWLGSIANRPDPMFFALVLPERGAAGLAAYLRITPEHGTIEIGHLQFGPALQRSRAGTEAMLLLMERAFALGYRRLEWKCHSFNARSRAAAVRYGFTYEGTSRNALVTKGRNRDTAWYAIVDADWPAIRGNLEAWLDDANFDDAGGQRRSLGEIASG